MMKGHVGRYYVPFFKKTPLRETNEEKMTEFLVHLRTERHLSASTAKLVKNVAIIPLRYARRKKIIGGFDFEQVIKIHGKTAERGILERGEAEALFKLEWPDPRSRLANLVASQTGMRLGEILALRVCDILEDRINVLHSWSGADGGLKCTKNRENRTIPIASELHRELCAYMRKHAIDSMPENLVFPGRAKEKPYSGCLIIKDLYEMLEKIGISDAERKKRNIVFHSWRHYVAKHLSEVTTRNIGMKILGHKTPGLFDHYANHSNSETFDLMKSALTDVLRQGTEGKGQPQF
jgi:integrase